MNNQGKIAIFQIIILLVAIISFSFILEAQTSSYLAGNEFTTTSTSVPADKPYLYGSNEQTFEFSEFGHTGTENPGINTGNSAQSWIGQLFGVEAYGVWDALFTGIEWAGIVYLVVSVVGPLLGLDQSTTDALAISSAVGTGVGTGLYNYYTTAGGVAELSAGWASVIGIGVGVAIFIYTYKEEEYEIVSFECNPWDAPLGGESCEECNKQGDLPCSEYQCKSLGQSCELINKGTSEESCTWVNRYDVDSPSITIWENILTPGHRYTETVSIPSGSNSPGRTRIESLDSSDGCIAAFTPLEFGIELDEPGRCKIDFVRNNSFEGMSFYFGGDSLFKYNHSQILSLPSPDSVNSESPTIENDGEYNLYARCQDANGNYNLGEFAISFCVDKGPDTTPPLIVATNLQNNKPIAYDTQSVDIELYVNEPSTCKFDRRDVDYDDMETTLSCSSSVFEMNSQLLYRCTGELTGLKNREANDFYFKCEDQPSKPKNDRNENSQSYKFTLLGSQPLVIGSVEPNDEVISDSTNVVKTVLEVETNSGFEEGKSLCYFSENAEEGNYILFDQTNSHKHQQELFLAPGNYNYGIRCIDLGGNSDTKEINFIVESDTSSPQVVRAYRESNNLKIVTAEEARCVYGTDTCNYPFDQGISLQQTDGFEHYTEWNSNRNYYIKCKDVFDNQPLPDQCSIIVKPFQIFSR